MARSRACTDCLVGCVNKNALINYQEHFIYASNCTIAAIVLSYSFVTAFIILSPSGRLPVRRTSVMAGCGFIERVNPGFWRHLLKCGRHGTLLCIFSARLFFSWENWDRQEISGRIWRSVFHCGDVEDFFVIRAHSLITFIDIHTCNSFLHLVYRTGANNCLLYEKML